MTAMEGELRAAAAGYEWFARTWGEPSNPPFLLIHGVTSDSGTFWRLGPALAERGRHVVAVDLPGHGETRGWRGRHRFGETAEDVAAFVHGANLGAPRLAVLGHSWGGMVAASLPAAGLRPSPLILLDPPSLTVAETLAMTKDPEEQPVGPGRELEVAIAELAVRHTDWSARDVKAKAEGLARFDPGAVRAVLLDNAGWDSGLTALTDQAVTGLDVWLIRGVPKAGGLVPDRVVPALEGRLGRDRVITIPGAAHSPQRTNFDQLLAAVVEALGD